MYNTKPNLNFGTIGNWYEGRIELYQAISMIMRNRKGDKMSASEISKFMIEPKKRMPFGSPTTEFTTDVFRYSSLDCHAFESDTYNLIKKIAMMDAIVLVIQSADRPMYENWVYNSLLIAKYLGINKIMIALDIRGVDDITFIETVKDEIFRIIGYLNYFKGNIPFVDINSIAALECGCANSTCPNCGLIHNFLNKMDVHFSIPDRDNTSQLYLPIFKVYKAEDKGTIVIGKINSGRIRIGDTVEISGSTDIFKSIVLEIESFKKPITEAYSGDLVGIKLRGVDYNRIKHGDVISSLGSTENVFKFRTRTSVAKMIERKKCFHKINWSYNKTEFKGDFCFDTSVVKGTIPVADRDYDNMSPDDEIDIIISLERPWTLRIGQKYIECYHGDIIGNGVVEEIIK